MAENCEVCPWRETVPPGLSELMRLRNLLGLGFTIPVGSLSRWAEDALLILDAELTERAKPPETESSDGQQ